MSRWQFRTVPFKFQLSDLTLFSIGLPLQVRAERLSDRTAPVVAVTPPVDELQPGSQGFVVRGLPVAQSLPALDQRDGWLFYVPQEYRHCFIDLTIGYDSYLAKFSSKTRSTITRKVRKWAEHSGGTIDWRTYSKPEDIDAFFDLAVPLSKRTYQDRLLDAGLPDTPAFRDEGRKLAAQDQVRGYILFHKGQPVSYIYCPVEEGVLSYAYVGYHPDYMKLSVGTVLQWLAVEQLYGEDKFRIFDFTEGESDHKRLFATDERLCANVFMVRKSLRNQLLVRAHRTMDRFSGWLGDVVERAGLKARIKRLLRFAR